MFVISLKEERKFFAIFANKLSVAFSSLVLEVVDTQRALTSKIKM